MDKKNLEMWDKVRTPDPKHTKEFSRAGGFKGTSTNVTYLVRLATEHFGPNGIGWGFEILDEKYAEGAPLLDKDKAVIGKEIIHIILGKIWYTIGGAVYHTSPQFGQTTFVGSNKYGAFTDEEAPKKSISDCMVKCLSLLGFAADIHLGLWDDNRHLAEVKKKFAAEEQQPQTYTNITEEQYNELDALLEDNGMKADKDYMAKLLKYLAVGFLSDLPASKFTIAKEAIKTAIEKRGGK